MVKPKRKNRSSFPPASEKPKPRQPPSNLVSSDKRPMRWNLVLLFLGITLGGTYLAIVMRPQNEPAKYTYEIVKTYPHDDAAFTQGLVYDDGFLWESTGREGESSVRKVQLETGEVLLQTDMEERYFGEGLAIHDDQLYQLTWKNNEAFVYNRDLEKTKTFSYSGDGWGLATNGTDLIFSNGGSEIRFLDPETFAVRRSIIVRKSGFRAGQLNELEYNNGHIYANVYQTDFIYEINAETGEVTAVINLEGLWPLRQRPADGVLNGIAFNRESKTMLVTGKLCPKIYEITLKLAD